MKLLLPGNPQGHSGRTVQNISPDIVGWLITPRRPMLRYSQDLLRHYNWAVDNECYTLGEGFIFERYLRFLQRSCSYAGHCLFVTVPDVVSDASGTWQRWNYYAPQMRSLGLPLAYVAQDGLEHLPEVDFACLFIGGSTEYKLSPTVTRLAAEAKAAGKWVHMGRVNSIVRMRHAHRIGVDSVDGTGWAKSYTRHLRWALSELQRQQGQLALGV